MVDACKLLGVDIMTGHWEFTYGMERVQEIIEKDFKGKVDFIAQNVKTTDFGDPVFKPYALREINGVPVAIIGQAFPYTPIANPRYLVPTGASASRTKSCRSWSTNCAARARRWWCCCRTTAWTST
jgi:2',3'-cyclic-nucleotide 2'-phosphodiesterase (5'-nucleotidase family)